MIPHGVVEVTVITFITHPVYHPIKEAKTTNGGTQGKNLCENSSQ
jgi:hypothetical protein